MSKYYYEVLEKTNEISKKIRNEEKVHFPEIVRNRKIFEISIGIFFVLYLTLIFSPLLFSNNIKIIYIVLMLLIIDVVIVSIYTLKYTRDLKNYPTLSIEKTKELKIYIEHRFNVKPLKAVNGLIEECKDYTLNRQRRYSIASKIFSVIMSLAIVPTAQLILKSVYEGKQESLPTVVIIILSIIAIIILLLLMILWDKIINEPIWGKESKNLDLLRLLKEVRYLMYEGSGEHD